MKKYVKIQWETPDYELPRLMILDEAIDNDEELHQIIQAKAKSKLVSVTKYQPKPQYLIIYVAEETNNRRTYPVLMLHLSHTCTEKYGKSIAMIKNFGRHLESEHIYDVIRWTMYEYILREEGEHTLYFREFIKNCKGEYFSILQLLLGIYTCFDFNIENKQYTKDMIQRLTEVWEN